MGYFLAGVALALGLFLIVGAFLQWRWLVDPPLNWSPYYSQALLKRLLGTKFVIVFTYLLGLSIMAFALYGIYLLTFGR